MVIRIRMMMMVKTMMIRTIILIRVNAWCDGDGWGDGDAMRGDNEYFGKLCTNSSVHPARLSKHHTVL